jgi:hypothetical protein
MFRLPNPLSYDPFFTAPTEPPYFQSKEFNTMLDEQAAHVEAQKDIKQARVAELQVVLDMIEETIKEHAKQLFEESCPQVGSMGIHSFSGGSCCWCGTTEEEIND